MQIHEITLIASYFSFVSSYGAFVMVVPKVEEKEVRDERKEQTFETIRGPSNKANDWFFQTKH